MPATNGHNGPVAVLGAGAWGTALANIACNHRDTVLWARNKEVASEIQTKHTNRGYLPEVALHASMRATNALSAALDYACAGTSPGLLILAVPLAGLRSLCEQLSEGLAHRTDLISGIIWTCKGLEASSGKLPSQIAQEALGADLNVPSGVLSGPSFAREVAQGLPVALTVASQSTALRSSCINALHGGAVRVYTSDDVVGVEVGGALKNIMAIACGISDGLGLGTNARAALITRGLAEMTRFGEALGARPATFYGLTGLGDLVLTATGELSRNRLVGLEVGRGRSLSDILAGGLTAEGARCAQAVLLRAQSLKVDMPITRAVCEVLFQGISPIGAVTRLLAREATTE
jgi:glycerol-3-phosphate dehydrogenase (NAD(P)+)